MVEQQKKAIIVEDNFMLALTLQMVIASQGWHVEIIGSMEGAREIIPELDHCDVAFVDGNLRPGHLNDHDGAEVVQLLRSKFGKTVYVVDFSGNGGLQGTDTKLNKGVIDMEAIKDTLLKATQPPRE